ncbi:ATP F0F1 synthase subunit B [Chelatococcus sp. GCM10030263]|jgi:F-type H+-transporting ATPase subunit b|uniref:F0F1 ATP synthase subunit B family protein n=1 Tax=Chelatococcus sp. GCM10030263 TaxID=3273387 RepID=UPI0036231627
MDAEFWVAVSFVVFLGVAIYFGAHKTVLVSLDARTKRIADELEEAKRFRAEAEALLKEYQAKRAAAETEAEAIVTNAREEAQRIAEEAHRRMNDFVVRRTAAAEAKIAQAEAQAAAEVRAAAAEAAIRASETVLKKAVQGERADAIFEASLAGVRSKLN